MKIGDTVTVDTAYIVVRNGNHRRITTFNITPEKCIFLGVSQLQEGQRFVDYDSDGLSFSYFIPSRHIPCWVVQPVNGNRWRKPYRIPVGAKS